MLTAKSIFDNSKFNLEYVLFIKSSFFLKIPHCLCYFLYFMYLVVENRCMYIETARQCSLAAQQVFVCLSLVNFLNVFTLFCIGFLLDIESMRVKNYPLVELLIGK